MLVPREFRLKFRPLQDRVLIAHRGRGKNRRGIIIPDTAQEKR